MCCAIKEILELSEWLFHYRMDGMMEGIALSDVVAEIRKRHLSKRPFHLNVIEAACHGRFRETGHSLVLADMLRHPQIQASFLETFLGLRHECMQVDVEVGQIDVGKIDVALIGKDILVIVENKVNGAREQECQMYKYVHDIAEANYRYDLSQVYVVYLNPLDHTLPSTYSLCDKNGEHNVFEALGEGHYTVQSYKHDITDWLRHISIDGEPHIASALDQYIDYLGNKFHTSHLDIDMNNEIKTFILKGLKAENKPLEEQITALDAECGKVSELLNAMDSLREELKKERSHQMMRQWQGQIEYQFGIHPAHDKHSFGIKLTNGVWLGVWDGHDSKSHLPYWGFQLDEFRKDSMPELYDQVMELLRMAGIKRFNTETDWVAWYDTQHGVERFSALYRAAQEKELL